jgi:hypothetical protein
MPVLYRLCIDSLFFLFGSQFQERDCLIEKNQSNSVSVPFIYSLFFSWNFIRQLSFAHVVFKSLMFGIKKKLFKKKNLFRSFGSCIDHIGIRRSADGTRFE